ncbi:MAG: hypothetical protein ACJA1E_000432 [Paracoccaceae bacterium]
MTNPNCTSQARRTQGCQDRALIALNSRLLAKVKKGYAQFHFLKLRDVCVRINKGLPDYSGLNLYRACALIVWRRAGWT